MIRSAPKDGYDFGNKKQYRREIWATFKSHIKPHCCNAQVLLMPSIEGSEIRTALQNGFREENLHIVDHNPAIVATLKRQYPRINTYGVDIEKACQRIAEKGIKLKAANFDLCGNLTDSLSFKLRNISRIDCWDTNPLIAVTVLRGREQKEYLNKVANYEDRFSEEVYGEIFEVEIEVSEDEAEVKEIYQELLSGNYSLTDGDLTRITRLQESFLSCNYEEDGGCSVEIIKLGIYKSSAGSQTMLWVILNPHRIE